MFAAVTIVKDEAKVIDRCLDATRGLVDTHFVIDTGSGDDTVFRAQRHPHARVSFQSWRDFGYNLTRALGYAGASADWVLRLDADMTVEAVPGFRDWLQDGACADAYMVPVVDGGLSYRLPLLTSGNRKWEYVGRTHEYLDASGRHVCPVTGVTVTHHADGGTRHEKLERDLGLLTGDDPRSVYYRAQTLRYMGDTKLAIREYRTRAEMDGWEEEGWHAEYCASVLADDPCAMIKAWQRRPGRAEPLAALQDWVDRHRPTTPPEGDILFVETGVYQ